MSTSVLSPSSGRPITIVIPDASTSTVGLVRLSDLGGTTSGRAVQGNDPRLGNPGSASTAMAIWAGTGAGGDAALDGSTVVSWGSWSTISGVRTLTVTFAGVIEIDTLTWDFTAYSSIAIITKGALFVIRSIVTVGTGTAYADWAGGNASGSAGGNGAAQVSAVSPLGGGGNGANGRGTSGIGSSAAGFNSGVCFGGVGGAGGAVPTAAGGSGGGFTRDYVPGLHSGGSLSDIMFWGGSQPWTAPTARSTYHISGGSGGGAGGNQVTGTSGGSGAGAGAILWRVGSIDMGANTLYIRAIGGSGAAASSVSGAGTSAGGGGGGGGSIMLVAASVTGTVILQAHGGPGGAGVSADADVAAGGLGGNGGLVACIYGTGTAPTGTATGGTGGTGSDATPASNGSDGTVYIVPATF